MNIHKNARLTPKGRENLVNLVSNGCAIKSVAQRLCIRTRTVSKWVVRYKLEGIAGLQDKSSRPNNLYRPALQNVIEQIIKLRRQRLTSKHIARLTKTSTAIVSRVLKRVNLSRMKDLEPKKAERRYCYVSNAFRDACKSLDLKHVRTKPHTPRTNGKAERFIQTAITEWAYAR